MSAIYTLDFEKNLFLYTSGRSIYLRTSYQESISKATLLCSDYANSFHHALYDGSLYYCYQSIHKEIVVKSLSQPNILYKKSSPRVLDYFSPKLCTFANELLLFYISKNFSDDTYHIFVINPLSSQQDVPSQPLTTVSSYPTLQLVCVCQSLFLCIQANTTTQLYTLTSDKQLQSLSPTQDCTLLAQKITYYENEMLKWKQLYLQSVLEG